MTSDKSSNVGSGVPAFSPLRAILWPVHGYEVKKVLPLAFMMFGVLFNYTIVRDVKDSLVNTAPGSGAEVLSFLKLWGTVPFAIILMSIYAKLSTVLSKPQLFRTMIVFFMVFFGAFGFFLFPMREEVHMTLDTMEALQAEYPRLKWVIPLIGNWTYSLFYVFSELWGTVGLSVLFWQFANEITKVSEAKRHYALFGMIGNVGLVCSGEVLVQAVETYKDLSPFERWSMSLPWIICGFLLMCVLILVMHTYVVKNVMTDARLFDPSEAAGAKKKKKAKLTFMESLKIVFSSKYLGYIALLVMGYGITINFLDVTWKSQIKLQYPDPADYTYFMGRFSQVTGIVTIVMMVVGANIVRKMGWFTGAVITPVMVLVTGVLFFGFILFGDQLEFLTILMGVTPLLAAVLIGAAQNSLSKGTKYALFDPTKEMAYIPLSDELKVNGKAAVDGVGGRFAKSGGSIIQQILLVTIMGSTQVGIAPYLAVVLIIVSLAWVGAVFGLNKQFLEMTAKKEPSAA